jgi:acylphosphatase
MVTWKNVRYSGKVQGVGFRYTAQQLATDYSVAGYVRNLPGGDVELVAGGEEDNVRAFLAALASQMAGYVEKSFVSDGAPGNCEGFQIRY